MANLLTMPLWQFGLIFLGLLFGMIVLIILYVAYLKRKKSRSEKNKLAPLISFFKDGLNMGYKKEALAKKAMKNGWALYECNRALKYLKEEII